MKRSVLPFFLSQLLFVSPCISAGQPNPALPKVSLERILDGRGNPFCDIARAERVEEGGRRSVWLVRGIFASDLFLRFISKKVASEGARHSEIWLADRAALGFERGAPDGRVTASFDSSSYRYFDVDSERKTIRCNLSLLAEEADRELLAAVAEYGLLKQALGERGFGDEEYPVGVLLKVEKSPPHPSPPFRKRVPLSDDLSGAEDLRRAVLDALERP